MPAGENEHGSNSGRLAQDTGPGNRRTAAEQPNRERGQ